MTIKAKGYVLAVIAAATYGMNPLFALPLYSDGMTPGSVLFFRYLFAMPLVAAMIKGRGRHFTISRGQVWPLAVLGLLVALSSLTLFESYNHMDAGIASTLLFVYPIMVAVIMALVFKERLTLVTIGSMALALLGICLLYQGGDGVRLSTIGTLLAMASALSYAIYIVGVNRPAFKDTATLTITFYVLLFGLSLFLAMFALGSQLTLPTKWYMWGGLVALALFPTAISFLCTTGAIHRIGSTPTAILGALEPLTAIMFGVMVFGERLTPRDVLGVVLILVAVTMVIAGGSITHQLVRLRKLFPKRRH